METERHDCHRDDLVTGLEVRTGKVHEISLVPSPGEIHVLVRDDSGRRPIAHADYTISGPHGVSLRGRTDANGRLRHAEPPVPIDHYTLEVRGERVQVIARLAAQGPVVARVPGVIA